MYRKNIFGLLGFVIFLSGCVSNKPFYNKKETDWATREIPQIPVKYAVYLLGQPVDDKNTTDEVFSMLQNEVAQSDSNHAIIFLSDEIYPGGLPDENKSRRKEAEKIIDAKLDYLKNEKGHIYFIPGDQLLKKSKKSSLEADVRLKKYVEKTLNRKNIFLPEDDCPGTAETKLTDDLIILPLNTTYWLKEKKARNNNCEFKNYNEWLNEIKDVLDNNQRKNILMLAHHPLLDVGNHGGFYSLKQHLFPLTDWQKNLYIPLPVVGSFYALFRAGIGTRRDISFPRYKILRKTMIKTIQGFNNVVYASGHEHNFQYFKYNKQDFIITNSSGDPTWVAGIARAYFTARDKGFVKLSYLQNGEVWMEILVADKTKKEGTIVYRKRLKDNVYGKPNDSTTIVSSTQIADSTILIAADSSLQVGKFKQVILGKHYRNAWTTPVEIPLIDLRTAKGGLEIVKKGGGFQTKSLRLRNREGNEFYLRSVIKYPEKLLGTIMLNTLVADVVKDQTSTTHPYAPYVVDDLSQAAGILHTNPEMVFMPKDKLLAEYRKDFANSLLLFEERANGKLAPSENFGYAREAISSEKMFDELHTDNGNKVDQFALLKSRLFDMWINDWDRHEGQWEWGVVECDSTNTKHCYALKAKNKYFLPIPKDRDQAFAKFDGIIPWIAGRKWVVRKFQNFSNDIRDVPGLNFNARNLDHALLTELTRQQWNQIASDLKNKLTDVKIEEAIKQFPDTIYNLDGHEIISKLKSRRNKLESIADRYYSYLAKYVDVIGSDKKEIFEANRLNNDSTTVKLFDYTNEVKGHLLYERTFITNETREIRLYGLKENDVFLITGKVKKGILIRVLGGDGNDSIMDQSIVSGCRHKTKVYDNDEKNSIEPGCETHIIIASAKHVNKYDFYDNDYNLVAPATFFGYNIDDGVFLGGGVVVRNEGFRKKPYHSFQRIVANASLTDGSFNFKYLGDFIDVFNKWGINTEVSVLAPNSTSNFFGLGNDTKRLVDSKLYYRIRYDAINIYPGLKRYFASSHSIKAGPIYDYINIINTPDRFINSTEGQSYLQHFTARNFFGGRIEYQFQNIDDSVITLRGIKWITSVAYGSEFQKTSLTSTNIESQLCLYIPFSTRATFALRGGAATRIGNYEFYQANSIGGQNMKRGSGNLRGYLRNRYTGRTAAYFNGDLRIKLWVFRTYLFPAHLGLLGFYDTGRVWTEHEKSVTWHSSYGGGLWIDPFAKAVINFTYAISAENNLFSVGIGFLF